MQAKQYVPVCIATIMTASVGRAFDVPVHRDITKDVLRRLTVDISGQPRKFSDRAVEQVEDANEAVDNWSSAALWHPERHFTNDEFATSSQRLVDLKRQILAAARANPPRGGEARTLLGQALHTLQDFYSHGNWVEQGKGGINTAFGRRAAANPAAAAQPCPADPNTIVSGGGGADSTSYFRGGYSRSTIGCGTIPAGKCYHGNYRPSCLGVNKDLDAAGAVREGVTMSPFHGTARAVADTSSEDYVTQILSDLGGNDQALSALLDVKGSLGFVVDDTGSMGEEIFGVQSVIRLIVGVTRLLPEFLRPSNYLVIRFGDPDVGTPFVSDDPDAALSAVNALSARGGGDCPELSQTALLRAVNAALPNSRLLLFTDASAKDSGLANTVIARAQEKSVRLNYALTGSCSPIDEAYRRGARETGGQLFEVNQFEIAKLFDLIEPQVTGKPTPIFSAQGDLPPGGKQLAFTVDSTVTRLLVSASIPSGATALLRRPGGATVNVTDRGVKVTTLNSGPIFAIETPEAGNWTLSLNGSGTYSAAIEGDSPLELYRFEMVAENEDIHGGFVTVSGQPMPGVSVLGEAVVLGPYASASFALVGDDGSVIQTLALTRNYPKAAREHFLGTFVPPPVAFRVAVFGTDNSGKAFQRVFPVVFRTRTVGVKVAGATVTSVLAGATTGLDFTVTNLGGASVFGLQATNPSGFPVLLDRGMVTLASGGSAVIRANVTVPAATANGAESSITVIATNTADANTFNSATAGLVVVAASLVAGDVNGDGRVDCSDIGIIRNLFGRRAADPGFDPRADVNRDGTIDVRDLAFVSQRLPSGTTCP